MFRNTRKDTYLVYVSNDTYDVYLKGSVRFANLINQYTDKNSNIVYYDFLLLTNSKGEYYEDPMKFSCRERNIISFRKNMIGKEDVIYHPVFSGDKITATYFTKSDSQYEKSITDTVKYPLGSGVYGWNVKTERDLLDFDDIPVYRIKCLKPFLIQDEEHLISVLNASNRLNIFLDKIKGYLPDTDLTDVISTSVQTLLQKETTNLESVFTLWKIALIRNGIALTNIFFYQIIARYLLEYKSSVSFFKNDKQYAFPLPINYVLFSFSFDSLLIDLEIASKYQGVNSVCYSFDPENSDIVITTIDK